MSQQHAFDHILASLHVASFDDAHWLVTSALIDEACGAKGNMLVFAAGISHKDVEIFLARFCYRGQRHEEWERRYFEVYQARDERIPRLRQLPDSRLVPVTGSVSVLIGSHLHALHQFHGAPVSRACWQRGKRLDRTLPVSSDECPSGTRRRSEGRAQPTLSTMY